MLSLLQVFVLVKVIPDNTFMFANPARIIRCIDSKK